MTETREPYETIAFESYATPTRPGEPPGVVPYAPLNLEAATAQLDGQRGALARALAELTEARAECGRLRAELARARADAGADLIQRAKAELESGKGSLTVIATGTLEVIKAEARAECERLRADEQRHAADWLTEFAAIVKPETDARRVLLAAADAIRDMGDWEGYEMHPETMSELERQIRAAEREGCAKTIERLNIPRWDRERAAAAIRARQ